MLFYNSVKWQRLRAAVLRRDNYICQYSKRFGKTIEAVIVHHLLPADIFPEYKFCEWNLISLSNEAHNKMHDRRTGELNETGREFAKLILTKRGKYPPPKHII